MQSRSAWLYFCGVNCSLEAEIRKHFSQCGMEFRDFDCKRIEGNGVLCFSRANEQLLQLFQDFRGVSRVIALGLSPDSTSPELSWKLLGLGASDVLWWNDDDAVTQIDARIERWSIVDELVTESLQEGYLVGESHGFRVLVRNLVQAARFTSTPILLTGESGTGKE